MYNASVDADRRVRSTFFCTKCYNYVDDDDIWMDIISFSKSFTFIIVIICNYFVYILSKFYVRTHICTYMYMVLLTLTRLSKFMYMMRNIFIHERRGAVARYEPHLRVCEYKYIKFLMSWRQVIARYIQKCSIKKWVCSRIIAWMLFDLFTTKSN